MRTEAAFVREPREESDADRLPSLPAPARRLRVVALGGGTGLPAVLSGLTRFATGGHALPPLDITAIVAMSDDGGSSGRLRREQGILPPGDLRNCLVALAGSRRRTLARLFQHRFVAGRGLQGHALGNLLLSALLDLEGRDVLAALARAERLLRCSGRVLPSTLEPVHLVGTLADGTSVRGQSALGRVRGPLRRVDLAPRSARAAPGVIEAIRRADVIVLGPGSLYSSVIATLLVDGVAQAVRESGALRVLLQNLMTQPGESDGLSAAGHLRVIRAHAGEVVDVMLIDGTGGQEHRSAHRYAAKGQAPVAWDRREVASLGVLPVEADLLAPGKRVRHDPKKAAAAVLGLAVEAIEI